MDTLDGWLANQGSQQACQRARALTRANAVLDRGMPIAPASITSSIGPQHTAQGRGDDVLGLPLPACPT